MIVTVPDGDGDDMGVRGGNCDVNHQKMILMDKPYHIKPGSTLKTVCEYNSMEKNIETQGGLGTDDEMCIVYVYYYPLEKI
jgi:hypothetical protein